MMKRLVITFCLFWNLAVFAESSTQNDTSINWVHGLSWEQVKRKAKQENKFIFLDIMATWCGPCKKMDKETFKDPEVIAIINSRFLPVKVQMDKTKNDNEEVQRWYADAASIGKENRVRAYPTFVFLSPEGKLTNKISGFRGAENFVKQAELSLNPSFVYKDPDQLYFELLEEYESHAKNYAHMPLLFKEALRVKETEVAWSVAREYRDYLAKQPKSKWFSRRNIEFLAAHSLGSQSPYFDVFYKNGKKVDRVMEKKGFAQSIVDKVILREISVTQLGIRLDGMRMMGGKPDTSEADWDKLYVTIQQDYGDSYAERVVLDSRLIWYDEHNNNSKFRTYLIDALEKFGVDAFHQSGPRSFRRVNSECWQVYLSVKDLAVLKTAAKWMKKVVDESASLPQHPMYIDTYACLLYKLGDISQALSWERKALQIAKEKGYTAYINSIERTLMKMEAGK